MHLPCKYGMNLHMSSPNTKSRSSVPTSVKGIQKTPNRISETAKFNKNTFVMVRIRRFWTNVIMTSAFPTIANNKMVAYKGICNRPLDNQSIHDVDATLSTIIAATVVEIDKLLLVTCCTWCWGNTDDSWYSVSLSSVQVTFCKYGNKVAVSFGVIVFHS